MNILVNFMKRNYKILLAVLLLSGGLLAFKMKNSVSDNPDKDKLLLELLGFVIEKGHYSPVAIDDNFSKGVYKSFIETLDPSKRFFLKSDITEFASFENDLDDQFVNKELTFFNLSYFRLMRRMEESKAIYKKILAKPIDFTLDETTSTDFKTLEFAANTNDLEERWRKQIKLTVLSSIADIMKLQENQGVIEVEESEMLNSTEQPEVQPVEAAKPFEKKSFAQVEKEVRERVLKSMDDYYKSMDELQREDWFSAYINALTSRFDPHTNYFAPENKERFDVSMSGKFEGIGARLQKKNDFVEIEELISGGPAWRGKQLESGDVILKVAQGAAEALDIIGMRLDEVVKKIKGPKGSEVRLTIKKVDGTIKVISIVRDVVEIEETYARSSIVEKNGLKYGVIYLPKFYIDFEDKGGRDAGKDIAIEVKRLKEANVNGIVLDVRDDGGGSLSTVVDIAGLFINEGPIVQIKSAGRKKEVLYDRDPKIEWDGPLVILVNSFSASASEILAAAIQDYKRGIILGSKQTYGKGTVQNVLDLNQFVRNSDVGDLGALKTTTQKFYRINGGSTQLKGVASDVVMPDKYAYLKMGERDEENAMPWDKIDAAEYTVCPTGDNFQKAIFKSISRIAYNSKFQLIEENAKWVEEKNKEQTYSLHYEKFRLAQKQNEEAAKKFKPLAKYANSLQFSSLDYEKALFEKDSFLKEKRERWHKSLTKDIYIEEALNVLDDLQEKQTVVVGQGKIKKPNLPKTN